jgi:hypothetical protein
MATRDDPLVHKVLPISIFSEIISYVLDNQ